MALEVGSTGQLTGLELRMRREPGTEAAALYAGGASFPWFAWRPILFVYSSTCK